MNIIQSTPALEKLKYNIPTTILNVGLFILTKKTTIKKNYQSFFAIDSCHLHYIR